MTAALGLVAGLRRRRAAAGCRTAVVATVESGAQQEIDAFVPALLDQGAFVIKAGPGIPADHLHHFPLRAAIAPRQGRLICVDLADHLACWTPGHAARLHAIPSRFDDAARALAPLIKAGGTGLRQAAALNLHVHLGRDHPGNVLSEIERLDTHCRALFLRSDGRAVATTADRLDGKTGTADLLIGEGHA